MQQGDCQLSWIAGVASIRGTRLCRNVNAKYRRKLGRVMRHDDLHFPVQLLGAFYGIEAAVALKCSRLEMQLQEPKGGFHLPNGGGPVTTPGNESELPSV